MATLQSILDRLNQLHLHDGDLRPKRLMAGDKTPLEKVSEVPKLLKDASQRQYLPGDLLGTGGFATCWKTRMIDRRETPEAADCALKAVKAVLPKNIALRFKLELAIQSKLHHPNVVEMYRAFTYTDVTYVALELCPNGSLTDMVKKRKFLTMGEIRRMLIQLCGAVKYLHQRDVVHRDIKAGNIFLDENMNIKLGDFGLAAIMEHGDALGYTRRTTFCGTPNYLAPELLCKETGHGISVDIWAIGVLAYYLAVGRAPFHAKSKEEIYQRLRTGEYSWPELSPEQNEIPEDLRSLVSSLLVEESRRPTPDQIVWHQFFTKGFIPPKLDPLCRTKRPKWARVGSLQDNNKTYSELCRNSRVGVSAMPGSIKELRENTKSLVLSLAEEYADGIRLSIPLKEGTVYTGRRRKLTPIILEDDEEATPVIAIATTTTSDSVVLRERGVNIGDLSPIVTKPRSQRIVVEPLHENSPRGTKLARPDRRITPHKPSALISARSGLQILEELKEASRKEAGLAAPNPRALDKAREEPLKSSQTQGSLSPGGQRLASSVSNTLPFRHARPMSKAFDTVPRNAAPGTAVQSVNMLYSRFGLEANGALDLQSLERPSRSIQQPAAEVMRSGQPSAKSLSTNVQPEPHGQMLQQPSSTLRNILPNSTASQPPPTSDTTPSIKSQLSRASKQPRIKTNSAPSLDGPASIPLPPSPKARRSQVSPKKTRVARKPDAKIVEIIVLDTDELEQQAVENLAPQTLQTKSATITHHIVLPRSAAPTPPAKRTYRRKLVNTSASTAQYTARPTSVSVPSAGPTEPPESQVGLIQPQTSNSHPALRTISTLAPKQSPGRHPTERRSPMGPRRELQAQTLPSRFNARRRPLKSATTMEEKLLDDLLSAENERPVLVSSGTEKPSKDKEQDAALRRTIRAKLTSAKSLAELRAPVNSSDGQEQTSEASQEVAGLQAPAMRRPRRAGVKYA